MWKMGSGTVSIRSKHVAAEHWPTVRAAGSEISWPGVYCLRFLTAGGLAWAGAPEPAARAGRLAVLALAGADARGARLAGAGTTAAGAVARVDGVAGGADARGDLLAGAGAGRAAAAARGRGAGAEIAAPP